MVHSAPLCSGQCTWLFQTLFFLSFSFFFLMHREKKKVHKQSEYIFLVEDKIENSNYNINEQKMDENSRSWYLCTFFLHELILFSWSIKHWNWSEEKFLSFLLYFPSPNSLRARFTFVSLWNVSAKCEKFAVIFGYHDE